MKTSPKYTWAGVCPKCMLWQNQIICNGLFQWINSYPCWESFSFIGQEIMELQNRKLTLTYCDVEWTTSWVATSISKGVCDSSGSNREWAARTVGPASQSDSSREISCCGIIKVNRQRSCSNFNCPKDVCWTCDCWWYSINCIWKEKIEGERLLKQC